MKHLFEEQLKNNKVATEETLSSMKNKTYYNGEPILVGDKPLFAMTREFKGDNMTDCYIKLIMLKEEHFDLFIEDDRAKDSRVPSVKLKDS